MKNTFGNNITITIFGESHGPYIGAVLDGLAPGMKVDNALIAYMLTKRRPAGKISTGRVEEDNYSIVSGVFEDRTTGTPLCILIPNKAQHSKDYSATKDLARPGHADYTAYAKYHGYQDYRGGGHFSGRVTAALVAAAAVVIPALADKGIYIGTHIASCHGVNDIPFSDIESDIEKLNKMDFAVLDDTAAEKMLAEMEKAAEDKDSVGGVLETAIVGIPAGVGEPFFDSVESMLSHGLFAIPAVKGVEFGRGFRLADMYGSEANDPFVTDGQNITTTTNNNGGINGGITNGMPIVFRTVVKPTPSIYKKQQTVDFVNVQNREIEIEGRHDPAIIHRARIVQDSITALTLADMLAGRYGTDYLVNEDGK